MHAGGHTPSTLIPASGGLLVLHFLWTSPLQKTGDVYGVRIVNSRNLWSADRDLLLLYTWPSSSCSLAPTRSNICLYFVLYCTHLPRLTALTLALFTLAVPTLNYRRLYYTAALFRHRSVASTSLNSPSLACRPLTLPPSHLTDTTSLVLKILWPRVQETSTDRWFT